MPDSAGEGHRPQAGILADLAHNGQDGKRQPVVEAADQLVGQFVGGAAVAPVRTAAARGRDRHPGAAVELAGILREKDLEIARKAMEITDVIEFADMPSSRASMFGSGKCAAARAYKSIYKLACIESYISDKVSGRRPLAVGRRLARGEQRGDLLAKFGDCAQSGRACR